MDADEGNAGNAALRLVLWLLGVTLFIGCVSQTAPTEVAKVAAAQHGITNVQSGASEEIFRQAAVVPSAPFEGEGWQPLFDGRTLTGWQVTDFGGHGAVYCEAGLLVVESGDALTGVNWTNDVPKVNYEVALDAMRVKGSDFFCGLTFPVKDGYCSLILGGWGGTMVGLSSVDGEDASENETSQTIRFETGRWYRVRVRVTDTKIQAWLDDKRIVDLTTTKRAIGLRWGEIEYSKPLGLATYQTRGAMREIKLRKLAAEELRR